MAERARDLIRQICHAREVVIIRYSVSPDHIHILVSSPAHLAPPKLVQYIAYIENQSGAKTIKVSKSPHPPSLEAGFEPGELQTALAVSSTFNRQATYRP